MIRHAKPEDADSCIRLMELVKDDYPGFEKESFLAALTRSMERGEVFISVDEDKLEGIAAFCREQKEITLLAVHPDSRHQGVATRLIYTIAGCFEPEDEVSVITYGKDDPRGEAARACYHSCGFEDDEEVVRYHTNCQRLVCKI